MYFFIMNEKIVFEAPPDLPKGEEKSHPLGDLGGF